MLILFAVSNYRSFYEEQELNLVSIPSTRKKRDEESRARYAGQIIKADLPGLAGKTFLKTAAVYGANGSGKSNLIHALAVMRRMVLKTAGIAADDSLPYDPFVLNERGPKEPTSFFAAFEWGGTRYEYSFEYVIDCVTEEELYAFPKRQRKLVFQRQSSPDRAGARIKRGSGVKLDDAVIPLVNNNVLLLSFLYGHPALQGYEAIKNPGQFFDEGLIVVDDVMDRWARFPHSGEVLDGQEGTDFQRSMIQKMIRDSDVGVTNAHVETIPRPKQDGSFLGKGHANESTDDSGQRKLKTVILDHTSTSGTKGMRLSSESLGTMQLFSLSSYIAAAIETNGTLVVDELDASLHPLLFRKIIGLFQRSDADGARAQLIFTAHQIIPILDKLLEKDQIWLAQKTPAGSTRLTPFSDYRTHEDENLALGYLAGRYEGIPNLPVNYGIPEGDSNGQA